MMIEKSDNKYDQYSIISNVIITILMMIVIMTIVYQVTKIWVAEL